MAFHAHQPASALYAMHLDELEWWHAETIRVLCEFKGIDLEGALTG